MLGAKPAQHSVHPTGGSRRVFKQFVWLEVGSVKAALSRPAHPRVTHTVRRQSRVDLRHTMSYDLMVFDPAIAPRDRDGFMAWYGQQTKWSESHDYENLEVTTPELQAWFLDMIVEFPSIGDPQYTDEVDNPKLSEYAFGLSIIYAGFAWSEAVNARERVVRLAEKHKVGFFDVSAENGQVWVPGADGDYRCIHGECSEEEAA